MQLDGLRVDLGHFEEGIDGLVRLLVEQEIQPLKIGARQGTGLMHHLAHVHARRRPAQSKKDRNQQQLPIIKKFVHTTGGTSAFTDCGPRPALRFRREISRRWRKMTPTRESAPSTAPPAKKRRSTMTSGACHSWPGNRRSVAVSVFWMENTTRTAKMMSLMAQVKAVMTFNKKGQ